MRLVLGLLGLQLATAPAGVGTARRLPPPPTRWAFVSAYVTIPSERAARRVKVVTAVFPLCDGHELPSAVFAAADASLRAAVRRSTRAPFTITHRGLEVRSTRDSAEASRQRGMRDARFARTLAAATDPACCCDHASRSPPAR